MAKERLNRSVYAGLDREKAEAAGRGPVEILQIGEGNFLRGFADWMIQRCRDQGLYEGRVAVVQPRPSGKPKIEALARQDGLYTLVIRGRENGRPVERREIVSVFASAFDPYERWSELIALAESPDLKFVLSNTTEAGLAYKPEPASDGERPIQSFPGKAAYLLYRRFLAFGGAPERGLIFLPCELLERNGDALRDAVLRYADDWGWPEAFRTWVTEHNRFLNSLVDRIVTGHPGAEQAEEWFAEWGYRDELVTTAEPYHLWAIEAEPEMDRLLPLRQAGLNVRWVDDLKPYQQRKVRILNGAHTLMAPIGLLHGIEHVRELMEDASFGPFVREAVAEEIVPSLPYPAEEMRAYAEEVFERYLNPFIRHRLADIAMNSVSKFKTRLLPTLAHYAERGERLPGRIVRGFAALLRYYRVEREGADGPYVGRTLAGERYEARDDEAALAALAGHWAAGERERRPLAQTAEALLRDESIWGRDLSVWPGLAEAVAAHLEEWGRREA